jgi:hypothetical protein
MTWTGCASFGKHGRGASKVGLNGDGQKVPLVGVGDTIDISHFDSIANISSASLSSCVDSSSCCASVGGRVRRLRGERGAQRWLDCEVGSDSGSSQTLAVLPSGILIKTAEGRRWSSNVFPPRTTIQSDHGRLAAIHAA